MKKKKDASTKDTAPSNVLSRRRFGQLAMMGLAGSTLMPAELLKAKPPTRALEAAAQERGGQPFSPAGRAEIEETLHRIFAEYGDRLSESQKQHMRGIVSNHVQMLETVRAIPLSNPDAPATVLKLVTDK